MINDQCGRWSQKGDVLLFLRKKFMDFDTKMQHTWNNRGRSRKTQNVNSWFSCSINNFKQRCIKTIKGDSKRWTVTWSCPFPPVILGFNDKGPVHHLPHFNDIWRCVIELQNDSTPEHVSGEKAAPRSLRTRGIQKVRRPTQLTTRYADRILWLFNIFFCN